MALRGAPMGSVAEAEAAAGAAAAAPAPTPKDNKKVWPKRRDMCDMNDKSGASIGSPRRSVSNLKFFPGDEILFSLSKIYCLRSSLLYFGENRDVGGGELYSIRCVAHAWHQQE